MISAYRVYAITIFPFVWIYLQIRGKERECLRERERDRECVCERERERYKERDVIKWKIKQE